MVQHMDPDHTYTKAEQRAAIELLDQEYRSKGTTKQFFGYCRTRLNADQVTCMQNANSFEDMSLCDKMFASK
jgi:hypothetical protein